MSDSFVTPWTVAHEGTLSMGFPRQNTAVGCHSFSRGSSWPRDHTQASRVSRQIIYHRATWEAHALERGVQRLAVFVYGGLKLIAATMKHKSSSASDSTASNSCTNVLTEESYPFSGINAIHFCPAFYIGINKCPNKIHTHTYTHTSTCILWYIILNLFKKD